MLQDIHVNIWTDRRNAHRLEEQWNMTNYCLLCEYRLRSLAWISAVSNY